MLKKKEGNKLELSTKEKSKVYGRGCGQACYDSCPEGDCCRYCSFRQSYLDATAGKFPDWPK